MDCSHCLVVVFCLLKLFLNVADISSLYSNQFQTNSNYYYLKKQSWKTHWSENPASLINCCRTIPLPIPSSAAPIEGSVLWIFWWGSRGSAHSRTTWSDGNALPGTPGDPVSGRAPKTKLPGKQASSFNVVSTSNFQYIAQTATLPADNCWWISRPRLLWRHLMVQLQFSCSILWLNIWNVNNAINPGELGKLHDFPMT